METEKKKNENTSFTAWGFVAVPLIFTFIFSLLSGVAERGADANTMEILTRLPFYFNGIAYLILGFLDRKHLKEEGVENPPNMGFAIFLPFVYLFKRCTLLKDEKRIVFWSYLGSLGVSILFLAAG